MRRQRSVGEPLLPRDLTALVLAAIVLIAAGLYLTPFYPDDTYISFRYAENLAAGHGLSFNPGERLEAYSNFLWVVILAGLRALGFSLTAVGAYVGMALALAGLWLSWRLLRRRVAHPAQLLLPLLVYATAAPFVVYAVSAMETALFGLLLLALVTFADRFHGRPTTAAWVGMAASGLLLALARPEGVVVLPAAVAFMIWDGRGSEGRARALRLLGASLAVFVIGYAAYTVWRVGYFGEWLPTPFMSKGYEAFPILTAWRKNFYQYFITGSYFEAPNGYFFAALALASAAGVITARQRDAAARTDRLALFLAAVMAAIYMNFVDWMPGMRYHASLVGLLILPLARAQGLLPAAWWTRKPWRGGLGVALALVLVMGGYGVYRMGIATRVVAQSQRECNIPLARWLKESIPPDALIAIGDVGAIPYYSGLRTLDIHRESLTDRHIAREGFTVDYVLERQPHTVVINVRGVYAALMDPLHYALGRDERFVKEYRFLGTVRHQWNLARSYWVYMRAGGAVRPGALERLPTGMGLESRRGFARIEEQPE